VRVPQRKRMELALVRLLRVRTAEGSGGGPLCRGEAKIESLGGRFALCCERKGDPVNARQRPMTPVLVMTARHLTDDTGNSRARASAVEQKEKKKERNTALGETEQSSGTASRCRRRLLIRPWTEDHMCNSPRQTTQQHPSTPQHAPPRPPLSQTRRHASPRPICLRKGNAGLGLGTATHQRQLGQARAKKGGSQICSPVRQSASAKTVAWLLVRSCPCARPGAGTCWHRS
jgi:hypothetical protein